MQVASEQRIWFALKPQTMYGDLTMSPSPAMFVFGFPDFLSFFLVPQGLPLRQVHFKSGPIQNPCEART